MKASPIQLHQLSFRRVSVELNVVDLDEGQRELAAQNLAFDGVLISTHVHFSPLGQEDAPGPSFLLTLQVVVNNGAADGGSASKPSPYLVNVEAGAIIRVARGAETLGDIEDIVVVNGTSLLWSAIREQVCNLTARMPLGLATLPTVHFQDLRKQQVEGATVPAKQGRARVSKPRPKVGT